MNLTEEEIKKYLAMANAIRFLSADAVENAKSGHPGMPMGVAEVVTILFAKHLKFNPENPEWKNRDRFILSAGHGSMLMYSILYLLGYPKISMDHIKSFRKVNSPAAGHPEFGELPGIETTTGPLGQGLGNGLGMAISEKIMRQRYGENVSDSTFVNTLYKNVLGRDADASGLNYWLGQLSSGAETRYEALLGFAESGENKDLFTEMTGFG